MGCSRAGNLAIQNSDLLIVIGSRLSSLTTGEEYCKFAREANTVVDIDENEHNKTGISIDKFIKSDANIFIKNLNQEKLAIDSKIGLLNVNIGKKLFLKLRVISNLSTK